MQKKLMTLSIAFAGLAIPIGAAFALIAVMPVARRPWRTRTLFSSAKLLKSNRPKWTRSRFPARRKP